MLSSEVAMTDAEKKSEARCKEMLSQLIAVVKKQTLEIEDLAESMEELVVGLKAVVQPPGANAHAWSLPVPAPMVTLVTAVDHAVAATAPRAEAALAPESPTKCSTSGPDTNAGDLQVVAEFDPETGVPTVAPALAEHSPPPSLKLFSTIKQDTLMPTRYSTNCLDRSIGAPTSVCTTAVPPTSSSTIATLEIGNTIDTDHHDTATGIGTVASTNCLRECPRLVASDISVTNLIIVGSATCIMGLQPKPPWPPPQGPETVLQLFHEQARVQSWPTMFHNAEMDILNSLAHGVILEALGPARKMEYCRASQLCQGFSLDSEDFKSIQNFIESQMDGTSSSLSSGSPSQGDCNSFISLDCGGADDYTDGIGIQWTSDAKFVFGGQTAKLLVQDQLQKQYSSLSNTPLNWWTSDATTTVVEETIILAAAPTLSVCLSNASTRQPFISTLEFRQFNGSLYYTTDEAQFFLTLSSRINFGAESNESVKYPDDPFDRIWESNSVRRANYLVDVAPGTGIISITNPIFVGTNEEPPEKVIQTAVVGQNGSLTYRLDLGGDPCLPTSWPWVQYSSEPAPKVFSITLTGKNITGSIPVELTKLSALVELRLDGNSFSGEIPDFSGCRNLQYTGALPSSLGDIPNLKQLYIQNNRLSGQVPKALFMKSTSIIDLSTCLIHQKLHMLAICIERKKSLTDICLSGISLDEQSCTGEYLMKHKVDNVVLIDTNVVSPRALVRSFSAPALGISQGRLFLEDNVGCRKHGTSDIASEGAAVTSNSSSFSFRGTVSSLRHSFTLGGKLVRRKTRWSKKPSLGEFHFHPQMDIGATESSPQASCRFTVAQANFTELPPSPVSPLEVEGHSSRHFFSDLINCIFTELSPKCSSELEAPISDAWWYMTTEELLPDKYRDKASEYRKGTDTMDVWFDSGSSWAAVLAKRDGLNFPADIYREGSDQHRGWFQSSLLTSIATTGKAPYSSVITHGFVLDEKGFKMSKSLGNVVDPEKVIIGGKNSKEEPGYGADVLRLWVSSVDYTGDVLIGPQILRQMSDMYRKLRGTMRFLLSNLHDWKAENSMSYNDLPKIDKYALFQLENIVASMKDSYENYQFYKIYQILQRFAVVDLSNFYFDVAKDRLYVGGRVSFTRKSCQTVLTAHLLYLVRAIAPIMPHLAEDVWQNLPFQHILEDGSVAKFVFDLKWPDKNEEWLAVPKDDVDFLSVILELRSEVNKILENARTGKLIGSSLDAKVYLHAGNADTISRLKELSSATNDADALHRLFITSQVEILPSLSEETTSSVSYTGKFSDPRTGEIWIGVTRADGGKCERCWNYTLDVGSFLDHPTLCARCHGVIDLQLQPLPAAAAVS